MHSATIDHRIVRRRIRTLATGLSALAVAGVAAGAATDAAQASAGHARSHPAARAHRTHSADRILEVLSTGNAPGASATMMRQYTDPRSGVRYLLLHQYAGRTVNYTAWEADTPRSGDKRSIEQVDLSPVAKTYSDQTVTKPEPAAPSFGIESTGNQVKRAIREGKATKEGTTSVDGRKLLKLKVTPPAKSTRHDYLDVEPSTYAPVQETKTYTSGRYTFHYLAHFAPATHRAVAGVETKPSRPAGYSSSLHR